MTLYLAGSSNRKGNAMASNPSSGPVAPPPPVWDAPETPDQLQRYAGFLLRTGAWVVDFALVVILGRIVIEVLQLDAPLPSAGSNLQSIGPYIDALASPAKFFASAVVCWAYFAFQESGSAQATLGKRLFGIRVSTKSGTRLSLTGASVRGWPLFLPHLLGAAGGWPGFSLGCIVSSVACLPIAFSRQKQGLHDSLAGAILTTSR